LPRVKTTGEEIRKKRAGYEVLKKERRAKPERLSLAMSLRHNPNGVGLRELRVVQAKKKKRKLEQEKIGRDVKGVGHKRGIRKEFPLV